MLTRTIRKQTATLAAADQRSLSNRPLLRGLPEASDLQAQAWVRASMAVSVLGVMTVLHRPLPVVGLLVSSTTQPQIRFVVGVCRPHPPEEEHQRNTCVLIREESIQVQVLRRDLARGFRKPSFSFWVFVLYPCVALPCIVLGVVGNGRLFLCSFGSRNMCPIKTVFLNSWYLPAQ